MRLIPGMAALAAVMLTAPLAAQQGGLIRQLERTRAGTSVLRVDGDALLDGNAVDVRDISAVAALRTDFRAADALLIAGLLPADRSARMGAVLQNALAFTSRTSGGVAWGLAAGTAVLGTASLPADAIRSLRDDVAGQALRPGGAFAGAAAFLTAAAGIGVPVLRGPVQISVAGEVRGWQAVAGAALAIEGEDALRVDDDGVTGSLRLRLEEPGAHTGRALGLSGAITARTRRLDVSIGVRDVGAVRLRARAARSWQLHAAGVPVVDLVETLDTLQPVLLSASTWRLSLPTTVHAQAGWRTDRALTVLARYAHRRDADTHSVELGAMWSTPLVTLLAGPRFDGGTGAWAEAASRVGPMELQLRMSTARLDPAASPRLAVGAGLGVVF